MTDKELRKLSRKDLLYMLISQGRELQELKEKYREAEEALKDRTIQLEKAGTIAEASFKINGVFEATEAACRQYTENIERLSRQQEELCAKRKESLQQAKRILEEAKRASEAMKKETEKYCAKMINEAKEKIPNKVDEKR